MTPAALRLTICKSNQDKRPIKAVHRLPASLSLQPSPNKTTPRHMFHSSLNMSQKTAKRQYSSITSQRFRFQSMAMVPSSHTQTSRPGRPKQQTIGSFPAHLKPLLPLQIVVISPQPCTAGTMALSRWSARWQYMFSRRLRLAFRQEALTSRGPGVKFLVST